MQMRLGTHRGGEKWKMVGRAGDVNLPVTALPTLFSRTLDAVNENGLNA
jgi:hypothetical protein